jgi:hypothetical protein
MSSASEFAGLRSARGIRGGLGAKTGSLGMSTIGAQSTTGVMPVIGGLRLKLYLLGHI